MGIGGRLGAIRRQRGLTLAEVAATTKISIATLRWLEQDELDRLPGGILTRGYLRAYAEAVGGGAVDMVEAHLAAEPLTIDPPATRLEPIDPPQQRRPLATLALTILGAAIYSWWSQPARLPEEGLPEREYL